MSSVHGENLDLPSCARLAQGPGGLPVLLVRHERHGALDVFLHGAHVTSWVPRGQDPVLWLSPASTFRVDAAIRGGVPICFPWFGGGPDGDRKPSHGYARLRDWQLGSVSEGADGVVITLDLTPGPGHESLAATYRVTMADTLSLELQVRNTGDVDVTFEEALHTYLAVGDVREVTVAGLGGAMVVDRLGRSAPHHQEDDRQRLTAETDLIYLGTPATVVTDDPGRGRRVSVEKTGSLSTVVWNPWAQAASAMADLGDAWTSMLCVETANVRDDAVTLSPGGMHTMTATISPQVLPQR